MIDISVVIPTYNRTATIMRSIESVLSQDYPFRELIIVDDCSTDNTEDVVRAIGDPRILYHRLPQNSGAATARNCGAELAQSDYIAFQDSDDVWRVGKLSLQAATIEGSGCDACISRFERHGYGAEAEVLPNLSRPSGLQDMGSLVQGNILSTQTLVVKRDAFLTEPFDTSLHCIEDMEWSIRFGANHSIYLVDEVLVDTYLQSDSITNNVDVGRGDYCHAILVNSPEVCAQYPEFHREMLLGYARSLMREERRGRRLYAEAFTLSPSPRTLCKLLLSLVGYPA